MMREVQKGSVVLTKPRPVAIPIGHYGARILSYNHLARHSA